MKRFQLVTIAVLVMILMLACATIGIGGDDNNDTQNQVNQEQNTNSQEDQIGAGNDSSPGGNSGSNEQDQAEESPTPPVIASEGNATLWETEFGKLLESGSLVMEDNKANADGETVGTILTVQFTNLSSGEILVSLPCGLVFVPTTSDEQALMMVQPMEVGLAAGESAEFSPFVVCIDIGASAPALNSGYTIGYLAGDDLLKFAECVCGQEVSTALDSMDTVGVQFAAWSVATGGDIMGMMEEEGAAAQDFLEGMELGELGDMITEMFSTFGSDWLDRCGITVGEE